MLVAVVVGTAIGFVATVRLALVVSATPSSTWLQEYVRLVDPSPAADTALSARAAAVSQAIADPMLYLAQLAPCAATGELRPDCLSLIDSALRAAPASGELWLFKAWTLVRSGTFSDELLNAIRNSYRVAPREGWIAASRVILDMKIYPILPDDLQAAARGDLALVIANGELAQPLARAYLADEALRNAAEEAVKTLPANLIERFVSRVRRSIPQT